jgi:hypothetical protein
MEHLITIIFVYIFLDTLKKISSRFIEDAIIRNGEITFQKNNFIFSSMMGNLVLLFSLISFIINSLFFFKWFLVLCMGINIVKIKYCDTANNIDPVKKIFYLLYTFFLLVPFNETPMSIDLLRMTTLSTIIISSINPSRFILRLSVIMNSNGNIFISNFIDKMIVLNDYVYFITRIIMGNIYTYIYLKTVDNFWGCSILFIISLLGSFIFAIEIKNRYMRNSHIFEYSRIG